LEKDPRFSKVDSLFVEWDRPDLPGCALAVIQDGAIVYKQAYGMADLERNVPLSPASVFDLASTSKQFVAMCILLLAGEDRLTLDDSLRQHIPEMPPYAEGISLRHLIHHTSGIRDYLELMELRGQRFENDYYEDEIIALLARQTELNFEPGAEHLYSNSGYFLLGEIVKRVSGQSLSEYAQERIFGPLGMEHTRFWDDFSLIVPNRAIGYEPRAGGGYSLALYHFDLVGDGGLLSSVEDLFLWDQNFYDNKLGGGGPGPIEQILTRGSLNSGEQLDYAFALSHGVYRGLPTVSHDGSWAGYRAEMIRFPEQRLSVICLSNLSSFNPTGLAKQVVDIFLEDQLGKDLDRATAEAPIALSEADLQGRSGDFYDPDTGMVLTLVVQDGRLMVNLPDDLPFALAPSGPDRFRSVDALVDIDFVFEDPVDGGPMLLHVHEEDEKPITFHAVERVRLDASELGEYAGEYRSEELSVTYRLLLRDDRLVLKLGYDPKMPPLEPVFTDEFGVKDKNLRFVRDGQGRISGFLAGADRVKNVWFARIQVG
jgi:CubicO group peptidase (beta-lactamase class C family)